MIDASFCDAKAKRERFIALRYESSRINGKGGGMNRFSFSILYNRAQQKRMKSKRVRAFVGDQIVVDVVLEGMRKRQYDASRVALQENNLERLSAARFLLRAQCCLSALLLRLRRSFSQSGSGAQS